MGTCVVVQGQHEKDGYFLLTCGPWGLNWGHQAWQQTPLSTEPSLSQFNFTFNLVYFSCSHCVTLNVCVWGGCKELDVQTFYQYILS